MSGRDLAKAIGRGPTYVRERINDEKEWALGDLERMCKLWNLQPSQLIEGVPQISDTSKIDSGELADRIIADPDSFDLAASTDPDKENEMNTPRE